LAHSNIRRTGVCLTASLFVDRKCKLLRRHQSVPRVVTQQRRSPSRGGRRRRSAATRSQHAVRRGAAWRPFTPRRSASCNVVHPEFALRQRLLLLGRQWITTAPPWPLNVRAASDEVVANEHVANGMNGTIDLIAHATWRRVHGPADQEVNRDEKHRNRAEDAED
jgi:hypothetical protein